jgi:hypothetical protein
MFLNRERGPVSSKKKTPGRDEFSRGLTMVRCHIVA